MGVHGYPGHLNADDVLSEVYRDGPGDVLAYAVKSSRTGWAQQIYVAYRSAGGGVRAEIVLVDRDREFTYVKAVGEDDGPWCYRCPAAILARLGPPRGRNAAIWRRACRAHRPPKYYGGGDPS